MSVLENAKKHSNQTTAQIMNRFMARRFFITIWTNEDKQKIIHYIKKNGTYGIVSDDDHTKDNQLHWHCYCVFRSPTRAARFKTTNAHFQRAWSEEGCKDYCVKKGPNYWEYGKLQVLDKNGDNWNEFVEFCKSHTPIEIIDSDYSRLFAMYRSFAGEVMTTFHKCETINGELQNEWYYGPTGVGKSRKAHEDNPDAYYKNQNKWWDGYSNQDVVIIEEWSPEVKGLTSYLKIWADRYPFNAEVKGSSMVIRPKKIIITSNYSMEECFMGDDLEALKRRFKQIEFHKI